MNVVSNAALKLPRVVPLEVWASDVYGAAAPGLNTLRRWARERRIEPAPEKHGRSYFVQPEARYVEAKPVNKLVARLMRDAAETRRK